jgi:hypothetical protein
MAEIIAQTLGQTRVRQRKARTAGERPAVGAPSECARVCGVATTGRRRGKKRSGGGIDRFVLNYVLLSCGKMS